MDDWETFSKENPIWDIYHNLCDSDPEILYHCLWTTHEDEGKSVYWGDWTTKDTPFIGLTIA